MVRAFARTHGVNVSITRCCNNYGPYQYLERVKPLFISNLLEGRQVPLYGDGGNVCGWVHVDDHCRGIQMVVEHGERGGIYHINGDVELTNCELTAGILETCVHYRHAGQLGHGDAGRGQEATRPPLFPGRFDTACRRLWALYRVRNRPAIDGSVVHGEPPLVGAAEIPWPGYGRHMRVRRMATRT